VLKGLVRLLSPASHKTLPRLTIFYMIHVCSGRTEPIPLPDKMDSMGLGRANIETRMLEDLLTKRPKVLESQRIATETNEQRLAREVSIPVAKASI